MDLLDMELLLLLLSLNNVFALSARNPPSDSILEIINTKEVERLLAERQENISKEEKRYLLENDLSENYIPPDSDIEIDKVNLLDGDSVPNTQSPRVDINALLNRNNHTEPYKRTELLADLRGYNGRKVLKSSKKALFVTRKEYLQKDWCKTEPLIQKIKEKGCITRAVVNRFCYGQCNSFFIPKNPRKFNKRRPISEETEDEDLNGAAFRSCSFCKPKKFTWVTVTLKCPSLTPPYRRKRIQRIKQCQCLACKAADIN